MGNFSAGAVLDRIAQVIGTKDDTETARICGVPRSTWGNWRTRDSVPYPLCVRLADELGICLDWLLTGSGPMYRGGYGMAAAPALEIQESPPDPLRQRRTQVKTIIDQLDAPALEALQEELEKTERMRALERRVAELEKKAG